MYNGKKIGVGILTHNRPDYYWQCFEAVKKNANDIDVKMVVNDGDGVYVDCNGFTYSNHEHNLGISKSKNEILSYLIYNGCDYMFIVEDDILIKSPECFKQYIKHHEVSGIHHFCCGSFLPSRGGSLKTFNYSNHNCSVDVYSNCAGSFCFYTRESLLSVGMFDEKYWNALEHVDLTYRLAKAGYTTPFGFFADISNSKDLIASIGGEFNDSVVNKENNKKVTEAFNYFKQKFGKGFPEVYESNLNEVEIYVKNKYRTNNNITN